jgi:hypothetical protein
LPTKKIKEFCEKKNGKSNQGVLKDSERTIMRKKKSKK